MAQERRPRIDSVLKAIEEGRYDEQLRDLLDTINGRVEVKRQALMQQVRDTFGEGYEITPTGRDALKGFQWNPKYAKTDTFQERAGLVEHAPKPGEEVIRPELPEDEPLTDEFESRSPQFGSIEDQEGEDDS